MKFKCEHIISPAGNQFILYKRFLWFYVVVAHSLSINDITEYLNKKKFSGLVGIKIIRENIL